MPSGYQDNRMPHGSVPFPFGQCRICNDKATGFHYGVATCEGCKGFFKRSIPRGEKYTCFFGGHCIITPFNRNRCKACRFQRCRDSGMAIDAAKMGRIPKMEKERALLEAGLQMNPPSASAADTNTSGSHQDLGHSAWMESNLNNPSLVHEITNGAPAGEGSSSSNMLSPHCPMGGVTLPRRSCPTLERTQELEDRSLEQTVKLTSCKSSHTSLYRKEFFWSRQHDPPGSPTGYTYKETLIEKASSSTETCTQSSQSLPSSSTNCYKDKMASLSDTDELIISPFKTQIITGPGNNNQDHVAVSKSTMSLLHSQFLGCSNTKTEPGIREFNSASSEEPVHCSNPFAQLSAGINFPNQESYNGPTSFHNTQAVGSADMHFLAERFEKTPMGVVRRGKQSESNITQHSVSPQTVGYSQSRHYNSDVSNVKTDFHGNFKTNICGSSCYSPDVIQVLMDQVGQEKLKAMKQQIMSTIANNFGPDDCKATAQLLTSHAGSGKLLEDRQSGLVQNTGIRELQDVSSISQCCDSFIYTSNGSDSCQQLNLQGSDSCQHLHLQGSDSCQHLHLQGSDSCQHLNLQGSDSCQHLHLQGSDSCQHLHLQGSDNCQHLNLQGSDNCQHLHLQGQPYLASDSARFHNTHHGINTPNASLPYVQTQQSHDTPAISATRQDFKYVHCSKLSHSLKQQKQLDGIPDITNKANVFETAHYSNTAIERAARHDSRVFCEQDTKDTNEDVPTTAMYPHVMVNDQCLADECNGDHAWSSNKVSISSISHNSSSEKDISSVSSSNMDDFTMAEMALTLSAVYHKHMADISRKHTIMMDYIENEKVVPVHPLTQEGKGKVYQNLISSIPRINQSIIGFSQDVQGFDSLPSGDQELLMKRGYYDIWMLTNSKLFYKDESYLQFSDGTFYTRAWMVTILNETIAHKFIAFAQKFNSLNLSDSETAILCAIQLTSASNVFTEQHGLKAYQTIEHLNSHFVDLLVHEVSRQHPSNCSRVLVDIFRLMPDLAEINAVQQEIIANFSTSGPPAKVEFKTKDVRLADLITDSDLEALVDN